MREDIFRKKNLDRINSPESLNDYIRVTNPGVWLVIAALIVLLIGACIWGMFGRIESTVTAQAVSENGHVSCVVSIADAIAIEPGMTVRVGDTEGTVIALESAGEGQDTCRFSVEAELPTGVYDAKIVTESITPFSFLVN